MFDLSDIQRIRRHLFDRNLDYILTHPLLQRILRHCAELEEQARALPPGSAERRAIESRIGNLQEYGLPKPTASEQDDIQPLMGRDGRKIGERTSIRRRPIARRRGRPAEWSVKVRAALEEKLSKPNLTWSELAGKFGFRPHYRTSEDGKRLLVPGGIDLECQVRRLRRLLKKERIEVPGTMEYRQAEEENRVAMATFENARTERRTERAAHLFADGLSVRDVAEDLGISKAQAQRIRAKWVAQGAMEKGRDGKVSHRPNAKERDS